MTGRDPPSDAIATGARPRASTDEEPPATVRVAVRYGTDVAAGRTSPDEGIDALLPFLTADEAIVRAYACRYLATFARERPERVTDVVDAVVDSLDRGQPLSTTQLDALSPLLSRHPGATVPLVERLTEVLDPENDDRETNASFALATLGTVGAAGPGAAKPAVPLFARWIGSGHREPTVEAMWALVRVGRAEPAAVRPFVASCVWGFDAANPESVASAVRDFGSVGWALPGVLAGVERLGPLLDHPVAAVRARAVEAVGRIGGTPAVDGQRVGRAAPELVADLFGDAVSLLDDESSEVRVAAAAALATLAAADPSRLVPFRDRVLRAFEDPEPGVREQAVTAAEHLLADGAEVAGAHSALRARLADDEREVQDAAASALLTLTGAVLGGDGSDDAGSGGSGDGSDDAGSGDGGDDNDDADSGELAGDAGGAGDHGEIAQSVGLVLWQQLTLRTGDRTLAGGPVPELCRQLSRLGLVPEAVEAAGAGVRVDGGASVSAVRVLGELGTRHAPVRWEVISAVEGALLDESRSVRSAALTGLSRLAAADPATHGRVAAAVSPLVVYGDADRSDAAEALAEATGRPDRLGAALSSLCAAAATTDDVVDREDASLETKRAVRSVESAIRTLGTGAPAAAARVSESLLARLRSGGATGVTAAAVALGRAVTDGGDPDPGVAEAMEASLREDDLPVEAQIHLAVALTSLDADGSAAARRRLTSLVESDHDALTELVRVARRNPDAVAPLVGPASPVLVGDHPGTVAAFGAASLRDVLVARRALADDAGRVFGQVGGETNVGALARLAETWPHAVPSDVGTPGTLRVGALTDTCTDSLALAERRGTAPREAVEPYTEHPVAEVREAAHRTVAATAPEGDPPEVSPVDPARVTEDDVDDVASGLAASTPGEEAARRAQLLDVARERPALRDRVVEHLLVRLTAVGEGIRAGGTLSALESLAPERDETGGNPPSTEDVERTPSAGDAGRPSTAESVGHSSATGAVVARFFASPSVAVRRQAALAAAACRSDWNAAVTDEVVELLRDDDALTRERAAVTAATLAPEHVAVERILEPLAGRLSDRHHVAVAAAEALEDAARLDPEALLDSEALQAIEERVTARSPKVRRTAVRTLGRLANHDADLAARLPDSLVSRLRDDADVRGVALVSLLASPVEEVGQTALLAAQLTRVLVETDDWISSHAAGTLLERLAAHVPAVVQSKVVAAADPLESGDEVELIIAEYGIYRALSVLAETNPGAAVPFAAAIENTLDDGGSYGPFSANTSESSSDDYSVQPAALRRAAATVAGTAGLACYLPWLSAAGDQSREVRVDPAVAARFLAVADETDRDAALETIAEVLGTQAGRAVVEASLRHEAAHPRARRARVETLDRLLDAGADPALRRRGVAAVVASLDAAEWATRRRATSALESLGRRGVLPPDEAVCHLHVAVTDDHARVRERAVEALSSAVDDAYQTPAHLVALLGERATSRARDATARRGSVAAVGALGSRYASARPAAVCVLRDCLDDPDRYVRRHAVRTLADVADIDSEAVRPAESRVRSLARGGAPDVRRHAKRCAAALGDDEGT
ncbi:MAG: hypothetical protein ABEJ22_00895 [Haloferacaceae archaeon]